MADNTRQKTVVIADYDYGDVDIERAIIEDVGLRLVAAQCKTEDDVIEAAGDADAIIAQYATVGARAIDAFACCRVIARYGTGGERQSPETIDATLAQRRRIWKAPRRRHDTGILSLYERVARSAAEGASIT